MPKGSVMTEEAAPSFSVMMNVYNGAPYLRATLDSLLAQTFTDWELVVWDDCSRDDSVDICRSYADPRIRIFTSAQNMGLGSARSAAFAKTRGLWVALLDQDDIWTPDKLERQWALILADNTGDLALVYGRARCFDDSGPKGPFDLWYGSGPLPEGDILDALLARPSFIPNSTLAVRRDYCAALTPFPPQIRYCTDYYWSALILRGRKAACVQSLCCHYRLHPGSMSHVFRREIHEEILFVIETTADERNKGIVWRRRIVHESFIGLADFRAGRRWEGAKRILTKGSVLYLILRNVVRSLRRLKSAYDASMFDPKL